MLFTLCLYPCIGCYSLIGILKYLSIFPCQALSHILFHHIWYHNYCILVIIQLHFNFQFFWTTFMFNLFYRLFRKDIFGAADEIELKFMDRFCTSQFWNQLFRSTTFIYYNGDQYFPYLTGETKKICISLV